MSESPLVKKMKVRATYSVAPGTSTTLHYPQEITLKHQAYTLAPKKVNVKFKYEWAPGLHTTFTHPKRIVKKHCIYEKPPKITVMKKPDGTYLMLTQIGSSFMM